MGSVGDSKILVKAATSKGITSFICRWLLRREYRVYRHLEGVTGVPRCYGLIRGRYLVLEYVVSRTLRYASIRERTNFFDEFLAIINSVHERGIAHGDLKRKDNILVVGNRRPYLIDFGVSTIRKRGFHPLNHLWHNYLRQHDLNAWVKHKYDRKFQNISLQDAKYYRPMGVEKIARATKRVWINIKNGKKKSQLTN